MAINDVKDKKYQCRNCRYAEHSEADRVIYSGNTTVIQTGGVVCKCPLFIRNISIINGELQCSGFRERGKTDEKDNY